MKTINAIIICGVIFMISFAMSGSAVIDSLNDLIEATTVNATYLQAKSPATSITLNSSIDANDKNIVDATNISGKRIGNVLIVGTGGYSNIQYAIDNLTSGRTWSETIIVQGDITLDNTTYIDSNTTLIIQGTITANPAQFTIKTYPNNTMFTGRDQQTTGNENIHIIGEGGVLVGSKADNSYVGDVGSTAPYVYAVELGNCENCDVSGLEIIDFSGDVVLLTYAGVKSAFNNIIRNSNGIGVNPHNNADNVSVYGNRVYGNPSSNDNNCIRGEGNYGSVSIHDNFCIDSGSSGIVSMGGDVNPSYNEDIYNNRVINSSTDGILIDAAYDYSSYKRVSGNEIRFSGNSGIHINKANKTIVIDNNIYDSDINEVGGSGILIDTSSNDNIVKNNYIDTTTTIHQDYGVDNKGANTLMENNIVANASVSLFSDTGTRWCMTPGSVGIELDNSTSILQTGIQGDVRLPWSGKITEATIMSRGTGNLSVQFWIDDWASFPPTVADLGGRTITMTGASSTTDTTLSGWTTAVTSGDVIRFNISAVPTVNNATILLKVCKN